MIDPHGGEFVASFRAEDYHGVGNGRDTVEKADKAARQATPLKIIKPEEWVSEPIRPREWIVKDWIPVGVVTGLYGDGGIGKSLLAQQLQAAMACGGEFCGQLVEEARSIGFFCEDDQDELLRRQARFNSHYNLDAATMANMRLVSRLGEDNLIMVFSARGAGETTPFYNQLCEAARDTKSRVVIIDTAADTFGGNENDRPQVRQYVSRALGHLALEINGAVLLCAHPSRSGLSSGEGDGGSTAWSNTLRSRLYISMPEQEGNEQPDTDARVLRRRKANYATRNAEIKLRWHDGVFVVDRPEETSWRPDADDLFMTLLDASAREGRRVSENKMANNYAPRAFTMRADRQGYRAGDFEAAMERLFAAKKIIVSEDGPPSKRVRFIVPAGGPD
jgi:RecA-family ATPase